MELDDWLQRIERLHPVKWDLGLERVAAVAERLGVLTPAPRLFLVGGTNGKGSTCTAIASLCAARGLKVGITTSPHLIRFNERIQIDGVAADADEICASFSRIEAAREQISLTYFEFSALAAMDIFKRNRVDVAVLEIGLGGRLDAMNIVEPDVSVITRIAMDHEAWLGSDRDAIAREKAGIMRAGRPCVIADGNPPEALAQCAAEVSALPLWIGQDFGRRESTIYVRGEAAPLEFIYTTPPVLPEQSLLAAVQATVVAGLPPDQHAVDNLFTHASLSGRFQRIDRPRPTILDVAHNPDAAAWLAERVATVKTGVCRAVVGMYRDKDFETVLATMAPHVDEWYLCQVDDTRGATTAALAECVQRSGGAVLGKYGKVSTAYEQAVSNSTVRDLILVFGSFPVVGGVLEHLGIPV